MQPENRQLGRRNALKAGGAVLLGSLAGCTGGGGGDGGDGGGGDGGDGGDGGASSGGGPDVETFTNKAGVEVGATFEAARELAKEEDGLTVYIAEDKPKLEDMYRPAFSEAYPEVGTFDYVVGSTDDLYSRWNSEFGANSVKADVGNWAAQTQLAAERGQLMELSPELLPNMAELDDKFVGDYWVGDRMKIGAMFFNTNEVSEGQYDGYMDIVTSEELSGQNIGWDPTPNLMLMTAMKRELGEEFFQNLANQRPRWVDSHTDLARFAGAGQFPVSFTYLSKIPELSELPLGFMHGGGFDWLPGGLISNTINSKANNPNSAILFVNWLIGEDGDSVQSEAGNFPIYPGVEFKQDPSIYPLDSYEVIPAGPEADLQATRKMFKDIMGDQIG